eukprot:g13.t1
MKGKAGTFIVLVLLALAATGVRGDATCSNGQVTDGAGGPGTAGDAGTTCECNMGYAGGGAVVNGGLPTATYPDCNACGSGQYTDATGQATCSGTLCTAGQSGPVAQTAANAATCTDCLPGQYTTTAGQATCQGTACATGKFGPAAQTAARA